MSWRGEEETPRVRNESTFGCAPPTYYNSQQAPLACQARREMLTYLSSAGNFEWQWGTGDQWVADTPRFFRGDHGLLGRTTVASGAGSHEGECFGGVGGARRPQEASPGLRRIKDEAPVASWARVPGSSLPLANRLALDFSFLPWEVPGISLGPLW